MHIIKRKAGNIPKKTVLNCWVNIFFFFFFSFHLAFSSCGSLLYLLQENCRQYWLPAGCEIHWQGKQFLWVLKAHLVLPLSLADEGTFPTRGLHCLRAPAHPSFPSLCQPSLEGGFTMARATLGVEDLQKKLPWFSLVLSARSLGLCSIPKLPWSAHAKGFVLAVSI